MGTEDLVPTSEIMPPLSLWFVLFLFPSNLKVFTNNEETKREASK